MGNITSKSYTKDVLSVLKIYWDQMQQALDGEKDVIMMQDNALVHKRRVPMAWLNENEFILMNWPPTSPDLNLIENIWAIIKHCIFHQAQRPTIVPQMQLAVEEEWVQLTQAEINCVKSTMLDWVQAVLNAEGGAMGCDGRTLISLDGHLCFW